MTWRYMLLMLAPRCEVRGPEAADAKAGPSHWLSLPACAHGTAPAPGVPAAAHLLYILSSLPSSGQASTLALSWFLSFFLPFYLFLFSWSTIGLQCCVSFFLQQHESALCMLPWRAQTVKNAPAMQETWIQSLGREDPREKGMAIHFRILAWRIPWTEEPSGLPS